MRYAFGIMAVLLGCLRVVAEVDRAVNRVSAAESLQAAIDAAPAGSEVRLAPGVHRGPVSVSTPLLLIGEQGASIEGAGRGHVIAVRAPDVTVRGLLIRRSGSDLSNDDSGIHVTAPRVTVVDCDIVDTLHGVYLRQSPQARIVNNRIRGRSNSVTIDDPLAKGLRLSPDEMCSVELQQDRRGNGVHIWNCSGHVIEGNDIRGTRDGIYFQFCDRTQIRRNVITDVRYGLHYMYSDENVFEENLFMRNAAGSAIMYSNDITLRRNRFVANRSHRAYGLLMHTVERSVIEENEVAGNTVGVFVENSVQNEFVGNDVRGNYIGLRLSDSSDGNVFTTNRFVGNVHAAETSGIRQENTFTRKGVGNFWEGALRLDLNGDGIADAPHQEVDLFGRWRRNFPEVGLVSGSPGERALRFVHSRIRLPGLPAITDPSPLASEKSR